MKYLRMFIAVPLWAAHTYYYYRYVWPVGLIAMLLAVLFRVERKSRINGNTIVTAPKWLWLWGNEENGYADEVARRFYKPGWPDWLNMWWWGAIRNSTGNLRFVKLLYPPPRQHRVKYVTGTVVGAYYEFTWQGVLSHLEIHWRGKQYSIGWKYYPADAAPWQPGETEDSRYGWRRHGCGFALRREDDPNQRQA